MRRALSFIRSIIGKTLWYGFFYAFGVKLAERYAKRRVRKHFARFN